MDIRGFSKSSEQPEGTVNTQIQTANTVNPSTELIAPVDEMLEYLKENNLTEEDVFKILDMLLTTGTVEWNFTIFGKLPVTFKMRPMWVNELLVKELEDIAPKTVAMFSEIVAKYNMSGSLINFNNEVAVVDSRDAFYANMERVSNLSYPVYAVLVKQLSLFDRLVSVATSAWAIENFMKPPLEESEQK